MASKKKTRNVSVLTPKKRGKTTRASDGRGKNPNSLANLKPPWKPGEPSPNPTGRPKLIGEAHARNLERLFPPHLIKPEMQRAIDATYGGKNVAINYAEQIAMQQQLAAAAGDVAAAREIRAATEGDTLRVFGKMTDAELDEFIAARQRDAGAGSDGTGTPPAETGTTKP